MFTYNKFVKLSTPKSKLMLLFENAEGNIDIDDMIDAMDSDNASTVITNKNNSSSVSDEIDDTFEPSKEQIDDYVNSLGEETDIGRVMPKDPEIDRLEQMLLQSMKTGSPIIDKKPEELSEEETNAVSNLVQRHIDQDSGNTPLTLKEVVDECRNIFDDEFVNLMLARLDELIPFCEQHRVKFTEEEKAELFNRLVYVYADPNKKTDQEVVDAEAEMLEEFIKLKHKPITDAEIFKETIKGGAMEAGNQMPLHLISGIIAKRSSKKAFQSFVSNNLRKVCTDIADAHVKQIIKNSGVQVSKEVEKELILATRRQLAGQVSEHAKHIGKANIDSTLKFMQGKGSAKTLEFVGDAIDKIKGVDDVAKTALKKSAASTATRSAAKATAKNVTKAAAKKAGTTMGKSFLKKIPLLGMVISGGLAAMEIWQGGLNARSIARAGAQLASGAASIVPGIGTAASIAIDVALAGEDIYHDMSTQKAAENNQSFAQKSSEDADKLNKLLSSI